MKTKLIVLSLLCFVFSSLQAAPPQIQYAVAAAGGTITGSGGEASFTVGQVSYTTNKSAGGLVAQGVQQSYESVNNINISTPVTATTVTGTTANVTVASGGELVLDAPKQVNNITVMPGGKLDASTALTVLGNVTFKADNTNTFSADISTAMTVSGTVNYVKTMDANRWYFMSFPCDVAVTDIAQVGGTLGALNTTWYINEYDGASRITNLGTTSNWIDFAGATLIANKGYIIALDNTKGTQDISFPLDKALVQAAEDATRTISNSVITAHGAGNLSVAGNHKGWNLVGQPFLSKFSGANASGGTGENVLTYISVPVGANGATYSQSVKGAYTNIEPFSAYFVQVDADIAATGISFATGGRHLAPSAVAVDLSERVQLDFTTATGTDNTNLVMDNNQTTAYEMNKDLEKMIGTGTAQPQVYTQLGGINYAYNALPVANVNNLPIGFYTKTATATTISATATAPSLSSLLLKDNVTGAVTDLLTTSYKFTPAATGTNTTRFAITAQRVPTDNVVETEKGGPQIAINNYKLIINNLVGNSSVRVYDAIGRMLVSKTTGNASIEIKVAASGIYTVQLQSGNKSWTKKVVAP